MQTEKAEQKVSGFILAILWPKLVDVGALTIALQQQASKCNIDVVEADKGHEYIRTKAATVVER